MKIGLTSFSRSLIIISMRKRKQRKITKIENQIQIPLEAPQAYDIPEEEQEKKIKKNFTVFVEDFDVDFFI